MVEKTIPFSNSISLVKDKNGDWWVDGYLSEKGPFATKSRARDAAEALTDDQGEQMSGSLF